MPFSNICNLWKRCDNQHFDMWVFKATRDNKHITERIICDRAAGASIKNAVKTFIISKRTVSIIMTTCGKYRQTASIMGRSRHTLLLISRHVMDTLYITKDCEMELCGSSGRYRIILNVSYSFNHIWPLIQATGQHTNRFGAHLFCSVMLPCSYNCRLLLSSLTPPTSPAPFCISI